MLISVTVVKGDLLDRQFQGEKKSAKDLFIAGCLLILSDKDYRQKMLCEFCEFVFRLCFPTALFSNYSVLVSTYWVFLDS